MASLTTAQKAELLVTDEYGNPVGPSGLSMDTGGSQVVSFVPDATTMWVIALQPGTATVSGHVAYTPA